MGERWNPPGVGILSTSASPELALLEQMVHLRSLFYQDLPKLVLLTISLPERSRLIEEPELPKRWRNEADFSINHLFLSTWLNQPDALSIGVPSAVVSESLNYLVHPLHPSFTQVKVIRSSTFVVDPRLWIG